MGGVGAGGGLPRDGGWTRGAAYTSTARTIEVMLIVEEGNGSDIAQIPELEEVSKAEERKKYYH